MNAVTFRALTADDDALLRAATLVNMNWTGEARFTLDDVDSRADRRHYTHLRPERGDFGVVAIGPGDDVRDSPVVGVVWLMFLGGDDPGYGHVADDIPELSINVIDGHRGRGIGDRLMAAALAEAAEREIAHVSLSVEAGNPAARLYRRHGFVDAAGRAEGTMVASTGPASSRSDR